MSGRRKRAVSPNEDAEEYCTTSPECSDSEYTKSVRRHASKVTKRKKQRREENEPHGPVLYHNAGTKHLKSLHILASVASMQNSLLLWYSTVRDARGMPWRKPFDPTLGPSEKAQRAYEVSFFRECLDLGNYATADAGGNSDSLLQYMDEKASSSIDDVNALWKGLGYYSRASRLLAGAQKAVKEYGGKLPDNAREMEANIPGIGRYSAGAICSIAYGERVPVLDGNVHRLLSRILALHSPPKGKATLNILWDAATAMVQNVDNTDTDTLEKNPGDINQALIELGSTVCKVREPSCESCPLRPWCNAYAFQSGNFSTVLDIEDLCTLCEPLLANPSVLDYPMKVDRKKARAEVDVVSVVEWCPASPPARRMFLLVRRPDKGLLAGLYEFPTTSNISLNGEDNHIELASEQIKLLIASPISSLHPRGDSEPECHPDHYHIVHVRSAGEIQHVFSHIKKTYRVQWVLIGGGREPPRLKASFPNNSLDQKGQKSTGKSLQAIWIPIEGVAEAK
ncbi:g-specific adenine dna glycosylase [Moniliophthora roreri]|nr:g-specific adenine dna glycosylase [Moniliophthora roreri]